MSALPQRNHTLRSLRSPTEALARIEIAGFPVDTTPHDCQGSAEQAGADAYDNGFEVSDAIWMEEHFQKDDSPDGLKLAEWLHGFWRAHEGTIESNPEER